MRFVHALPLLALALMPLAAHAGQAKLEQVASFDHQVTGVSVSQDGRVFVNFPRWTEDAPVSVAEVTKDGYIKSFPDESWNAWRNTKKNKLSPKDHFVCVQSVVVDHHNNLWIVDAAAPGNDKVVKDGPKLVKIDLNTNKVIKTIPFDEKAAPTASYLNDVRFSPDDKYAYLTDSGKGALIVVDLESGKIRRLLEGDTSTLAEKDVVVKADGKELRRPDGRAPEFNADGIELSKDGKTLYWQALTGKTLYSVPTSALIDEKLSSADIKSKVKKEGENGVADGLWLDDKNTLYISAPEQDAVLQRVNFAKPEILIKDERLRWPDTFSQGPDGAIYLTTSHIQDSPWFKPSTDKAVKTELWKFTK